VRVEAKNLTFAYGDLPVLRGLDFAAESGEVVAVLGANGAGKSTLFRCMLGLIEGYAGSVLIDGKDAKTLTQRDLAKRIAYIPQSAAPVFNHTAMEVVLMGLTNRLGLLEAPKSEHIAAATAVMEKLGITHLQDRGWAQVSGGERQLILLARALAQDAPILVMDEPTANLDYGHQHRALKRVRALGQQGYTVILSTHNPAQAFRYATRVVVLSGGIIVADGAPNDVLTEELIAEVYGIDAAIGDIEYGGKLLRTCVPVDIE
jgi:iron complex transport system ATP-binding protein